MELSYGSKPAEEIPFYRQNLSLAEICPDCKENPPNLITEGATLVCESCGLVLQDRVVSLESEWRTFNTDESKGDDPNRVGEADSDLTLGEHLETRIGTSHSSSKFSRSLAAAQSKLSSDKTNKSLAASFRLVDIWSEKAALTKNIKDLTKSYLMTIDKSNQTKLRSKHPKAVVAACIFVACRYAGMARSFSEITSLTEISKKELGKIYKLVEEVLKQSAELRAEQVSREGGIVDVATSTFRKTKSTDASTLCLRFCNLLGLDMPVETIAHVLAEKLTFINELAGRSPLSNAGACIYFASHFVGEPRSAKEVSAVAGVSDTTIKGAYKFLFQEREKLLAGEDRFYKKPFWGKMDRLPQLQN